MSRAWAKAVAIGGAGALLLAACATTGGGSSSLTGGSHSATIAAPAKLSGSQLRYGASATKSTAFVYQPDVVVLAGGAESIKAASSDGLIWTIDGGAANAAQIQPGKVLLATSFAAGRVLAVKQVGSDEQVALGPVALTDVIRDGTFSSAQPLALTGFQAYSTPDQPGLETATEPDATDPGSGAGSGSGGSGSGSGGSGSGAGSTGSDSTTTTLPTAHLRAHVAGSAATPSFVPFEDPGGSSVGAAFPSSAAPTSPAVGFPPPAAQIPPSQVGAWHVQSACCTAASIHVRYDQGGARVVGTATIGFDKPSLSFRVSIGGGHLISASAEIHGGATLGFGISAAVQSSAADFHGGRIGLPVDLDIPVPVAGLPVTIGLHQYFSVSLGLSGRAALSTSGEYALRGNLGFSVVDGRPSVDTPSLTTTKSALDSIQSLAVAPQALTFSYALRVSIGIGPPGLNAGIWYQIAAALGLATSGSQLDPLQGTSLVTCKTVSLSIQGRYGVGYTIPKLVVSAINLFLHAFAPKARPVAATGGPSWGPTILFQKSTPPCTK
ncbi:MAG TPA: hypothetical protein VGM93_05330 [Acidimicrobiales bacterium]